MIFFLNQKSELATKAEAQVIQDLLDTLKANKEGCVGMAANMIGVKKRIIVISMGDMNVRIINLVIVNKSGQIFIEIGESSI
ncbi:MAG: peptide deformylase [Clostridium sp.]|uniref:peptide deformylase n=1 Tax=Clostridium sp. TaxID=1506 RepID=UPI003D6D064D